MNHKINVCVRLKPLSVSAPSPRAPIAAESSDAALFVQRGTVTKEFRFDQVRYPIPKFCTFLTS